MRGEGAQEAGMRSEVGYLYRSVARSHVRLQTAFLGSRSYVGGKGA